MLFLHEIEPLTVESSAPERPLGSLIAQPLFITAVLAGTVAYGVMSLIMTATPVQMHNLHGFSLADTTWVIQSHIIAMYLPSLFSGVLFRRLGVERLMLVGVLALLSCVALGLYSQHLLHYWGALVLLGVGWNFMFVGATVLLTQSYRPSERFQAQTVNDFTIFAIQAVASLSAGSIIYRAGWPTLMAIAAPALLVMLVVLLRLPRQAWQPITH
jgi:MFS family permease